MSELFSKISSYNLLNYLLAGVLFAFFSDGIIGTRYIQTDLFFGIFLYYFIGVIISRFGSLIVEPVLKKSRFIVFADRKEYLKVAGNNPKLEELSEANNMYRTLLSGSILLLISILANQMYMLCQYKLPFPELVDPILLIVIAIIFLFSYRKQTKQIKESVDVLKRKEG